VTLVTKEKRWKNSLAMTGVFRYDGGMKDDVSFIFGAFL